MKMWASDLTMSSPVSATELAERLRLLTQQTIDYERNLQFPKHFTATITDQRFDFVVGPSMGRGRTRLRCSGTFSPTSEATTVYVPLRPSGETIFYFGLLWVAFAASWPGASGRLAGRLRSDRFSPVGCSWRPFFGSGPG
jgi:hypothetical protein